MKLTHGLTAALAGFASATGAQQPAQVYLLSKTASSQPPSSIPASLARLIFLQRLSPFDQGPSARDAAVDASLEDVVAAMNHFGKAPPPMQAEDEQTPKQLVVMLEDMTAAQMTELRKQVKSTNSGSKPAFEIPNPPSTRANDDLVDVDFFNAGVASHTACELDQMIDTKNERCWAQSQSNVAKYNVEKNGEVLDKSKATLEAINKLTADGSLEVMIVALPAADAAATPSWQPSELRRRQAEAVMSAVDKEEDTAETSKAPEHDFFISTNAARKPIPACFSSEDSCVTGTGNCSGHGQCLNRYAKPDGSDGKEVCFTCHCLSTVSESGSLTQWAGGACSKKDVSTPFWLFFGFTIALLGILYLAIGMLFSVGEETLPGVIGAGVSRTSK